MKIKWGNFLIFLLVIGGVVGYFQWDNIRDMFAKSRTASVTVTKDSTVYARDTWITGGVPELGIARGYNRDYKLDLVQKFYSSDQERLTALGKGDAHFSEMSFPSLLFNLEKADKGKYQDQIVVLGFIDYSRGGDGIIVRSGVKTVNDLASKKVGYFNDGTGKYLLSFLLRMVDMRFEDVKGTPYSDEDTMVADFAAGKLDAIAYWQPGINDVLKKVSGSRVLLSTADMPSLIPDVLIANRKYVAEHPDKTDAFVKFWFTTVKHIQEKPDLAYDKWAAALNQATYTDAGKQAPIYGTDNTAAGVKDIFAKEVRLVGFDENIKLMVTAQSSDFVTLVNFAVDNWNRVDSLKGTAADKLFNNRVLAGMKDDVTLKSGVIDPSKTGAAAPVVEKPKEFSKTADPVKLDEVAQMAIPSIEFEPDSTAITAAGKKVITDTLVPLLRQFPNFYLLVDGHTDVGGDEAVLTRLSQGRADSVKKELVILGFPDAQFIARGFGDKKPVFANPKNDTEKAKNRRTEFRLLRDK
ncbi:MAG TPA: phosphate ABC transporter substrate-binding/OmpA family protein [Symbiobacteriaceae bacterium]|jgi:outer membrane protein OmpA-like peptidoglycan-associated protein/ABC-type nitrate/sulfonate/bicarbonate transport system substrate-binding protein